MPAASEPPPLPHTWRPLGVRVAVTFFGVLLVTVCTAAWLGFDDSVRERFTLPQRATVLGLGGIYAAIGWALGRCRVTATDDGLTVVNGFRTHRLAWPQVLGIHLPTGAPWGTLDLADGTTLSAMGFQGSDGDRAQRAVRELRSLIDA